MPLPDSTPSSLPVLQQVPPTLPPFFWQQFSLLELQLALPPFSLPAWLRPF